MKVLYQWAQRNPTDWQQIDAADWDTLAIRREPNPGQLGGFNNLLGWINDVCVQGVHFNGSDHVAVENISIGGEAGVRVTNWWDDPIDYPPGERRARIRTFLPLAPDTNLGNAINTRQSQVVYAEGQRFIDLTANPSQNTTVLPWADFAAPTAAITRHQVWLTDVKYGEHVLASHSFGNDPMAWGWRDWTEELPDSEIEVLTDGRRRLLPQRAQGRYKPSEFTQTWFLRDTNLTQGWITAINEDALSGTAGAGETESVTTDQNLDQGWAFASPADEPNNADWPDGVYRTQLDCSAASAGLVYNVQESGASVSDVAEWRRLSADLTRNLEQETETNTKFSGTGLKLATSGTEAWTAGDANDRFGFGVGAEGDGDRDAIALDFTSDAFADGAWPGGVPENPDARGFIPRAMVY